MFYDKKGSEIRKGSSVRFNGNVYTIEKINGDSFGLCGTSTLTLDRRLKLGDNEEFPCEENIELVKY
jgi:hypothetical protein